MFAVPFTVALLLSLTAPGLSQNSTENNATVYIVMLHRHLELTHLTSLAAEISEKHSDLSIPDFEAPVMNVMHDVRMMTVSNPSPAALESIAGHALVQGIYQDMPMYADKSAPRLRRRYYEAATESMTTDDGDDTSVEDEDDTDDEEDDDSDHDDDKDEEDIEDDKSAAVSLIDEATTNATTNATDPIYSLYGWELPTKAGLPHRTSASTTDNATTDSQSCNRRVPYNWGLDRIDQRVRRLNCAPYRPPKSTDGGKTVDVYVLDTGIQTDHREFGGSGRTVKMGNQYASGGTNGDDNDGDGHGTHVASIIGGKHVGVAPSVNIIAIKVLDDRGTGSSADIIAALNHIMKQKRQKRKQLIVVNMSLGSSKFHPLDQAVNDLTKAGVPVVVSAGNDGIDACKKSPAGAAGAITVAASSLGDSFAFGYSNYGSCVDIIAPGNSIEAACSVDSLGCKGNDDYVTYSGTSMAAPFVTGVLALSLRQSKYPNASKIPSSGEMKRLLKCSATTGALQKLRGGTTPNKLLHNPVATYGPVITHCIKDK